MPKKKSIAKKVSSKTVKAAKSKATIKSKSTKSKSKAASKLKSKTKPKSTRKYSKAAQEEIHEEMHEFKQGKAHSGPKERPVKSREQAIAIGLSKARKKGEKVPKAPKKKSSKK